jgi:hypothetical protein
VHVSPSSARHGGEARLAMELPYLPYVPTSMATMAVALGGCSEAAGRTNWDQSVRGVHLITALGVIPTP